MIKPVSLASQQPMKISDKHEDVNINIQMSWEDAICGPLII